MATMIIGNIKFVSKVSSKKGATIGKTNAATMRSAGRPYFFSKVVLLPPSLNRGAVTEEPSGPEHQNQDEHGEDHDRRPPDAYVLVGHGADDADQEPPDHRPGQVADAAQHRRRERVEPLLEAHVEDRDAVEEPVHHARGSGQDASEEEGDGDRAVHIDPYHRRRLLVLGDGTHRLPLLGVLYEVGEGNEQRYRHRDDEEVLPAEDDRIYRQDVSVGDELWEGDLEIGRASCRERV